MGIAKRGAVRTCTSYATLATTLAIAALPATAHTVNVEEQSIDQLQAMMQEGSGTSVDITRAYLARIAAMDRKGPALHSIIALNPDAVSQARQLDAERKAGHVRGPLHGIPILIKDNIETADPIATTAGSLALRDNITHRDAPVVASLRRAGAVILGKTNLSEWANIRSTRSMSGWSAVGGLVRNPYALDRTACGSSSGSGAAVAASFAAAAIGTETDGSVVCPSSINGVVGMKPTIGLISQSRIVPISHSQDTAGPMARSVRDAALMLTAMASPDIPGTNSADVATPDYLAKLSPSALAGTRVGVIRPARMLPALAERYEAALQALRDAGAVLVEVKPVVTEGLGEAELLVLRTELKADLDTYLATTPAAVKVRTLDQLIAFNQAHAADEMPFFAQEIFEDAVKTRGLSDPAYKAARQASLRQAGENGIDAMLKATGATVLVQPTTGAAWPSDPINGDQSSGPSASKLPAVAGYPHLTVPMGAVRGMPVGLSFIATRGGEQAVLAAGYAYEQRTHARVPPRYLPRVAIDPDR